MLKLETKLHFFTQILTLLNIIDQNKKNPECNTCTGRKWYQFDVKMFDIRKQSSTKFQSEDKIKVYNLEAQDDSRPFDRKLGSWF